MKFPVFDLHCDTAYALLGSDLRQCGSLLKNTAHIDLERAGQLGGYAQCFACFTTTEDAFPVKISPTELFEREMVTVLREIERNADRIRLAYSWRDIENNLKENIASAILTIEGPAGFDFDPELLTDLYQVGFRMTTLCWNESNPLTGSHATGGGLTERGIRYVREAQRLGMLVDVSHISDEAFWDVVEISQAPVIASHSNSRAIKPHSRNITDDMFRAICDCGGVVGINLYGEFLDDTPTLDSVCRHISHFVELDPKAEHIALGGDLDGCELLPADFSGIQDYNKLALRLREWGLTDEQIQNIFWNNALGVMKRCYT